MAMCRAWAASARHQAMVQTAHIEGMTIMALIETRELSKTVAARG